MANPWEKYQQQESTQQDGPWSKYAGKPAEVNQEAPQYTMTPEEIQAKQEAEQRVDTVEPERSLGEKILGAGETGLSLLTGATTGAAAAIPSGITAAIGDLTGILTPEEAQQLQERAMAAVTYEPRTEAGQEYTGAIGDVLNVLPPVTGAGLPSSRPKTARGAASAIAREEKSFKKPGFKSAMSAESPADIQGILGKGDEANIATAAKIDPAIEKAASDLGMKETGITSSKATDPNFIANEQMLKSVPGSKLQAMEDAYIAELNTKADDLINTLGSTDKAAVDRQIFDRSNNAIKLLAKTASDEYTALTAKIDPKTPAKMKNSRSYVNKIVENVGGVKSRLTPLEKELMNLSQSDDVTYTAVDRLRKRVGAALGRESDVFKSETRNSLNEIYEVLTNDQEAVAPQFADSWAKAKGLVAKRKELEDQAVNAFGKKLTDSYIPKLGSSLKQLGKGKHQEFNKLISSIDKRDRPKAIATALSDVFQGSSQQPQMTPAAFDSWYRSISRNGVKQNLYKYLPGEFTKTLDDIAKVTEGVRRAQKKEITTGRLTANPSVAAKSLNLAIKSAMALTPGMIAEGGRMLLDSSGKRPEVEALKVLTNPDFIRAVSAIAEGNAKKAKAYENKVRATKAGKQALGKFSILGFLNSFDEEQTQNKEDKQQ